jgi:hypothetical protein
MRKLLLISFLIVQAFSLDIDDIKIMREMGVKIAFPNEAKAHTIPKGMKPSKLMKANYLNLNGASIYSIPKWLPKMTNITRLELANTNLDLEDLPDLTSLRNLDILNLSGTKIFKKGGNLLSFLSNFRLNELNLANTGGSSSDYANIGKLSSLIKLDLSGNSIFDIDELNLEKLTNLKVLNLSNNNLSGTLDTSKLPKSSLRELYLSYNSFTRFKFSGDFPLLKVLDISNNGAYMSFDEEFDDIFLFKSMDIKRGGAGKFNKDMSIPKSIMKRLGIKSKWIDVHATVCRSNGAKMSNGVCVANWKNAKKICSASGGRLATKEELEKVVTDCGGIFIAYDDKDWSSVTDKNIANQSYQSCYQKKGFASGHYWSSTTYAGNSDYAWRVRFNLGSQSDNRKNDSLYVRCVRAGQ